MQDEGKLSNWVKTHKTGLTIGGLALASIMATVLLIGKKDAFIELRMTLFSTVSRNSHKPAYYSTTIDSVATVITEDSTINKLILIKPSIVSEHIRNLSGGRQPSAAKLSTAVEHGFSLQSGQTWVEEYNKQCT